MLVMCALLIKGLILFGLGLNMKMNVCIFLYQIEVFVFKKGILGKFNF